MTVKIYINNEQLSLFEQETISLTSSVLDVQDITKNTTDYSKEFTVPADEINNYIFRHYYNANIDNLFDARVTVDGHIELDGFIFRVGKFVLRSVNVVKSVASSYTINFWGNLVSLKDAFGDDELKDLDLDYYNHNYDSDTVKDGLTGSLKDGDLIYTLFVKRQLYYNSLSTDQTQTDELTNIAYNGTAGDNGVYWNELKPSLRLIKIIEAIETKYADDGVVFSRHFFSTEAFTGLYMWLNNDEDAFIGGGDTFISWDSGSSDYINFTTNLGSYPLEDGGWSNRRWFKFHFTVYAEAGYENVEYTMKQWVDTGDGNGFQVTSKRTTSGSSRTLEGGVRELDKDNTTEEVYWTVEASQEFKFSTKVIQNLRNGWRLLDEYITYGSVQTIESGFVIANNIPELKIIDFLKGIFQAFKLVVIPLQTGEIYVNTLNGYYAEGELLDFTDYVLTDKHTVNRGNVLNEIIYKFQDPQTILNLQFEENTGSAYGDEEELLKQTTGDEKLLEGGTVEIELPFEQVIYERLIDQQGGETNIQYGAIVDKTVQPTNIKPHVHYSTNQSISSKPISFIDDNDAKISLSQAVNVMQHSNTFENPNNVFLFSKEFSTWNSEIMNNTLYAIYHAPYIADIFSPKRRNFVYQAQLPLSLLLAITLNDVIKIQDDFYRIDKFTIDTVTGRTELNLVNSLNITIGVFSANPTDIVASKDAQTLGSYVTNLTTFTTVKTDLGFGTDWVTTSTDNINNVYFTFEYNEGAVRVMEITLIKDITLEEIIFSIKQESNSISPTVDSTTITVDNTQITI